VTRSVAPEVYAREVAADAAEYAGFHLIAGEIAGTFAHVEGRPETWSAGTFGISNGPADAEWEKVGRGIEAMQSALESFDDVNMLTSSLLAFLRTRTYSASNDREIFVVSERYGTRSSTVIAATEAEIAFTEQSYGEGGKEMGEAVSFRFPRG
jgi:uncharacterized protein with NRDE domain